MSFARRVNTSLPCPPACDGGIESSRSDASTRASIVAIVCSSNSRIAPRTVAAMIYLLVAEWKGLSNDCRAADLLGQKLARARRPSQLEPDGPTPGLDRELEAQERAAFAFELDAFPHSRPHP